MNKGKKYNEWNTVNCCSVLISKSGSVDNIWAFHEGTTPNFSSSLNMFLNLLGF